MKIDAAIVWKFDNAPENLKRLSTAGGDEDWIVELPESFCYLDNLPFWVQSTGVIDGVEEFNHPVRVGWRVVIGSHG